MPALATTSRAQLSYKPEVVPGTAVTGTACYGLRMIGESFSFAVKKESDKEIRSDRQRTSVTTVSAQSEGGLNVHMQYGEYDQLFEGLMQSTWVAAGTNGVTASLTGVTVATGTTAPVITGTGLPLLAKGQWFQFSHTLYTPTGQAVNTFALFRAHPVTASNATTITCDTNTLFNTVTVASGTALIRSSRITNGVVLKSYTVELQIPDIAIPVFQTYRGMFVSKFSISLASSSLTTANFDFLGFNMTSGTTTGLNATRTASQTYDVQNAVTGVGNVWEGGAPLTSTFIKSITLNIDNTLRGQEAIGNLGLVGVGIGTLMVTGSVEIYFADGSLYNKFLADTFTALSFYTKDVNNNGYVFTLPRVMLTSGKVDAGGKDADMMASFSFEAYADVLNADVSLQKTLFIDRFGAAVLPVV
jgi:hypothetical protein